MEHRSFTDYSLLLLAIAVCSALVLPALFMDGMFMDGILYAAVSKNFGQGEGTFWNMHFSQTYMAEMHEQPPLMFALQGMFFKVLGNSMYTERIYSALTAIITIIVLLKCWKLIAGEPNREKSTGWFVILLWIIMQVTFFAFINNVEECTMTLFSMLAFLHVLKAMRSSSATSFHWLVAGLWILAAGLTKGIQGMFLVSAPFWCWLILKNGSFVQMLLRSMYILLIPAVFIVIAWFTPVIHESFAAYFDSRYGQTFIEATTSNQNRFKIWVEFFNDILPPLLLAALFLFFGRKTTNLKTEFIRNRRMILFILACGFSGIIPLMITLEQRGFYLVTAFPLIIFAVGLSVRPVAARFTDFVAENRKRALGLTVSSIAALVAIAVITIFLAGHPKRDAEKLELLHEVAAITGEEIVLGVPTDVGADWSFINYAQRYHGISITDPGNQIAQWVLCRKGENVPAQSTHISLNSPVFDLYRKTTTAAE